MEEEKAAAYYDDLARKGEGAAKFKQGLGYSSSSAADPPKTTPSSSSFLTTFVRASNPNSDSKSLEESHSRANLKTIRDKLSRKTLGSSNPSSDSRHGSSRKDPDEKDYRRTRRDEEDRRRDRRRGRSRSRSSSPRRRGSERRRGDSREENFVESKSKSGSLSQRNKNAGIDYSRLIEGYSSMKPAERVKAKMKLQLSQTAAKDSVKGEGWERFDFNKDAALDDEEIEAAEDDANLVRDMGRSFQFSALELKREADTEVAHDQAMFGVPATSSVSAEKKSSEECTEETDTKASSKSSISLMSEKVTSFNRCYQCSKVLGEIEHEKFITDEILTLGNTSGLQLRLSEGQNHTQLIY